MFSKHAQNMKSGTFCEWILFRELFQNVIFREIEFLQILTTASLVRIYSVFSVSP